SSYHIWAAKPELNKKWAKEFLIWCWNLDVQQALVEKGGGIPIRSDFTNDKARADKLQEAPKTMLEYMKNNKVKGQDIARDITLTDPNEAKASKLVLDSIVNFAAGKQEPLPILKQAED